MIWFKLIFKQNQPIHIGTVEWGVINETEIFIPGWTMWGALTNQFLKTNGFDKIDESKKIFEKITNFYPMVGQGKEEPSQLQPLFPQYKGGVFSIGDYTEEEFKFKFVDTLVSTAVGPVLRSAKDESLHEFEYILPRSKLDSKEKSGKNNLNQLYWIGLIGFEDDIHEKIKSFLETHPKVYIGGDSKYGFGELELCNVDEVKNGEELKKWNLNVDGTAYICINSVLKQFLNFLETVKFEGEIKLIAEFDFTQNVPRVQKADYFIKVGSKVLNGDKLDFEKHKLIKGKFLRID
jgi:hypothetical protein